MMIRAAIFDEEFRIEGGFPIPWDEFWIPVMGQPCGGRLCACLVYVLESSRMKVLGAKKTAGIPSVRKGLQAWTVIGAA